MILGLVPLAVALAACQTYPDEPYYPQGSADSPAPYPAPYPSPAPPLEQGNYRAVGTEPFWDLTIGPNMVFTDRGSNVQVIEPTPAIQVGAAGGSYSARRLRVNIVRSQCNDGMSERVYPDTVEVTVDKRLYRGCGGPDSSFVEVDQRGNPRVIAPHAGPVTTLERTRWKVVRINGRPVPRRGDYHVDFDSGRIAARFGCNSISGPYTQTDVTLDLGALASTRMACPNMAIESQGSAILGGIMTIEVLGRNRLALSSTAGTIELVRR
jgi:heat shock protein HslJ